MLNFVFVEDLFSIYILLMKYISIRLNEQENYGLIGVIKL